MAPESPGLETERSSSEIVLLVFLGIIFVILLVGLMGSGG